MIPAVTMLEPLSALVEQIVVLRATTAEGVLARAQCRSFHWLPQADVCQDNPEEAPEDRMMAAEMRDLVAMERGAVISRAVAVQAPSRHLDADLLKACGEFDALERASLATFQGQEPGSAEETAAETERERLSEAQEPLVERMCELEAITREGVAARARSLALWDAELMKPDRCFIGDRLTAAIVRDLLAGSAGA